jgi:hypothetical protein
MAVMPVISSSRSEYSLSPERDERLGLGGVTF